MTTHQFIIAHFGSFDKAADEWAKSTFRGTFVQFVETRKLSGAVLDHPGLPPVDDIAEDPPFVPTHKPSAEPMKDPTDNDDDGEENSPVLA